MPNSKPCPSRLKKARILRGALFALLISAAALAHAADSQSLPRLNLSVVKPVIPCDQLAKADLSQVADLPITIQSAFVTDTPKGQFCKVLGGAQDSLAFEIDLPLEHWTQRFLENASNSSAIANGGSCAPATNGEFVVAFISQGQPGAPAAESSQSPQQRFAIQNIARHATAQVSKALIKIFYGQPQRFSYFMGCSTGGGQALNEVERYPDDFDGVSAGSPLIIPNIHNIFYHPWESYINKRADGSRILAADRLPILHKAILDHCAAAAGLLDGVLPQPTACKFNPSWVQCKSDSADTSNCLTAEEARVVQKLYEGPGDTQGHHFEIAGFATGSELLWGISTATHVANREANIGPRLKAALLGPESAKSPAELQKEFDYTQDWYDRVAELAPYADAANTNIRPFQKHGGKLILWNGAEDLTIQPEVSVIYYQGVQKALGDKLTDSFMRLFLIPGYGHCGPGELPFQFEILSPLMTWTELGRAPEEILAGNPVAGQSSPSPYMGVRTPYAAPDQPTQFTRPIYPFPYMAAYSGQGDPTSAASYKRLKSGAPTPEKFDTEAAALIGPDNQKTENAENYKPSPNKK